MGDLTQRILKMLLPVAVVLSGLQGYGQCSLVISNYSDNVAGPTQITVSGTAATQYTWQFGDAGADTTTGSPMVSHQYADTGSYHVCVYGYDSNTQCYDTVCQTLGLYCSISGSVAFIIDTSGVTHFTAHVQAIDSVTGYTWLVTGQNGNIVYNNTSLFDTLNLSFGAGNYLATVIVSTSGGCSDSIRADTVSIDGPPQCIFLQQGTPQGEDTYIRSDLPNVNFGLSPDFLAQQWFYQGSGNSEARGLLKFDLSAIPAGSVITSATISLYADSTTANSGNGYPGEPTYGSNDQSVLQRITSPWNHLSATWHTQPSTTSSNQVTVPQSTDNAQNYTLDVSAFLQFWVQHPDSNFGIMLSMPGAGIFNNLIFCSSAHPNPALRPALNICYQSPPNACNASFAYTNTGDSVWFYLQSAGVDSVHWKFDDGDSSTLTNPVHYFALNGIHLTTCTIFDSTGSCSSVTPVNVTGIINDTFCGVVFFDNNMDHLYDYGDYPMNGFEVVIDGNSYYTDNTGFFHAPVGGGGHVISVVVQQFSGYTQSSPTAPLTYSVSTTNNDYICGLDFGLNNGTQTGIETIDGNGAEQLSVFPNPVIGTYFQVSLPRSLQIAGAVLTLVDVLGRETGITHVEIHAGVYTVYLAANIQAGLYTLRYTNGEKQLSGKVLVIR